MNQTLACALAAALLLAPACQPRPQSALMLAAAAPYANAENITLPAQTGLAFSPDSQSLLVGSDEAGGVFNAYSQATTGADRRALTGGAGNAFPLSYFPAGERIVMRTIEAGGQGHIGVRFEDGVVRDLTPGSDIGSRFLGWRLDGRAFFITTSRADTGASIAYAVDASSLERTALYQADGEIDAISRDGRWLAFTNPDINVVDLQAPQTAPRLVASRSGMTEQGSYEFAPDGRSLIYANDESGAYTEAWRYDLASGEHTPVMQAQVNVLTVTSSPSGRYRVFELGELLPSDVVVVDQQNDRTLPLSAATRDVRFNREESQIAFRLANDPWPQDVFVSDLDGGHIRRLVHSDAARD